MGLHVVVPDHCAVFHVPSPMERAESGHFAHHFADPWADVGL